MSTQPLPIPLAADPFPTVTSLQTAVGAIKLVAGFNTRLSVETDNTNPVRPKHRITIDMERGAGMGSPVDCGSADQLRAINGVAPDSHGNFKLLGDGKCYWVTKPYEVVGPERLLTAATLKVNNNCSVCCTCEEYKDVYEVLGILSGNIETLKTGAWNLRSQYTALCDLLQAKRDALKGVHCQPMLYPKYGWRVSVQVAIFNNGNDDLERLGPKLLFHTEINSNGIFFSVVPDSVYLYTPQGQREAVQGLTLASIADGWYHYTLEAQRVLAPGETALLEFELYFDKDSGRTPAMPLTVRAWLDYITGVTPLPTDDPPCKVVSIEVPGAYNL